MVFRSSKQFQSWLLRHPSTALVKLYNALIKVTSRVLRVCALLISVVCTVPLSAEQLDWLYDVDVEVPARSLANAERAIEKALEVCLMRVSGQVNIGESEVTRNALQDPSAFLLQYRYKTVTDSTGIEKDVLEANFDRDLIKDLSRRAQLPIWPSDRPTILMWMSNRSGASSTVLRTGTSLGVRIAERAKDRGVELVLPLMDLADRQLVNSSSIEGKFWVDLLDASGRYSMDLILAVSSHMGVYGKARLDITLWFQDQEESVLIDEVEGSAAGIVALDHAVKFLADRFSISRETQHVHPLHVSNIDSVLSYASLLEYLGDKEFIDRLEVASFYDGVLELEIYTPSTAQRLETLVESDLLSPELRTSNEEATDVLLKFAWQGSQ